MLKRFPGFCVCLLLVLMPLQAISAAHMSICNSLMKANNPSQVSLTSDQMQIAPAMSCHKHMGNVSKKASHSTTCKTSCATLCASLSAITALPGDVNSTYLQALSQILSSDSQIYVSITQPNLQRPPILLS